MGLASRSGLVRTEHAGTGRAGADDAGHFHLDFFPDQGRVEAEPGGDGGSFAASVLFPRNVCPARIAFGAILAIWTALWIGGLFWWPEETRFGFFLELRPCVPPWGFQHGVRSPLCHGRPAEFQDPRILALRLCACAEHSDPSPSLSFRLDRGGPGPLCRIGVMSAGWHQFVVHGRIIGSQLDGYPGPVRLQLLPPVDALGGAAPLVVTGRTRAGDMLNFLREGPGRFRFSLDHWGAPITTSPAVTLKEGAAHTVEIVLGSLMPPPIRNCTAGNRG